MAANGVEPNCGSGLARESGLPVNKNVDWKDAFASKPAPTLDKWQFSGLRSGFVFGVCRQALKCRTQAWIADPVRC
ncbi:hypothetical protein C3E97_003580 [Pseudomonas sp. MWU12-2115]|nr:hypothetical protein C3E97_003580 [Pseudomonas sp. MWU12-2115]